MISEAGSRRGRGAFTTTRWSLVAAAGDPQAPEAREALASLCGTYWPAVYTFLRRQGNRHDQALELTQGFFSTLLEKNFVGDARRERGRFRTFLLASVKHYVANERDREQSLKRGGGRMLLSLDQLQADDPAFQPPSHEDTPERLFDRRWARMLLDTCIRRLREEMQRSSGLKRFEHLLPFLTDDNDTGYREVAAAIGVSETAAKGAAHRLRVPFRSILRGELAQQDRARP